jgi:hypothetical protein
MARKDIIDTSAGNFFYSNLSLLNQTKSGDPDFTGFTNTEITPVYNPIVDNKVVYPVVEDKNANYVTVDNTPINTVLDNQVHDNVINTIVPDWISDPVLKAEILQKKDEMLDQIHASSEEIITTTFGEVNTNSGEINADTKDDTWIIVEDNSGNDAENKTPIITTLLGGGSSGGGGSFGASDTQQNAQASGGYVQSVSGITVSGWVYPYKFVALTLACGALGLFIGYKFKKELLVKLTLVAAGLMAGSAIGMKTFPPIKKVS